MASKIRYKPGSSTPYTDVNIPSGAKLTACFKRSQMKYSLQIFVPDLGYIETKEEYHKSYIQVAFSLSQSEFNLLIA